MNNFSERLKKLREERNFKQIDVCKILNLNKVTYWGYEKGKRQPDYDTLLKIANFFDVSVDYLLGKSEISTPPHSIIRQTITIDHVNVKNEFLMQRLKQLREIHKLTQFQLAEIIGTTQTIINNYENGKETPDINIMTRLSKFFNVSVDYLLGLTGKSNEMATYQVNKNDIPNEYMEIKNYLDSIRFLTGKMLDDLSFSEISNIIEAIKKIMEENKKIT